MAHAVEVVVVAAQTGDVAEGDETGLVELGEGSRARDEELEATVGAGDVGGAGLPGEGENSAAQVERQAGARVGVGRPLVECPGVVGDGESPAAGDFVERQTWVPGEAGIVGETQDEQSPGRSTRVTSARIRGARTGGEQLRRKSWTTTSKLASGNVVRSRAASARTKRSRGSGRPR